MVNSLKKYLLLATLALLTLAGAAMAQTKVVPTLSEECGKWGAEVKDKKENGKGGERATVYFEDFHIKRSKKKANHSRDCNAKVEVTIPAGKRLKFISAVVEGSAKLYKKSKAEVSLKADIDLMDQQFSDKVKMKKSGDFKLSAEVDDPTFSKCSDKEQVMTIDLDLRAYLKHRGKGTSVLEMDDLNSGHNFTCNWQWKNCGGKIPPPFQKPLTTYYKFHGERAYKAMVDISDDSGKYQADDKGVYGLLTHIEYSDDKMNAKGQWLEEGYSGWFNWMMIDATTGRFRGSFGKEVKGADGIVRQVHDGEWWGYYSDATEDEDDSEDDSEDEDDSEEEEDEDDSSADDR